MNPNQDTIAPTVAIVGGGPAGLAAAEELTNAGVRVDLYDAMPSLGRKFLMAGKSGLNLTHAEPIDAFRGRFMPSEPLLSVMIGALPADAIRAWAKGLGVETFVGSSGRVFPAEMKAAPLLRAWLKRLRENGLRIHVRHRWLGWQEDDLLFETPDGSRRVAADIVILALGGASWPRLGSDGAWTEWLAARGVDITPLQPSNSGIEITWSDHLRAKHEGQPLKGIAISLGDDRAVGDAMITRDGLEGGPVYTLSSATRAALAGADRATVSIDLLPDIDVADLSARLARKRGKASMANHLRRAVGLSGAKAALLFEDPDSRSERDMEILAQRIKAVPLDVTGTRPIDEAISSAGGVTWDAVDDDLCLKTIPGVLIAGEMLDWDAPTGGYLLTGCLASGRWAGLAALRRFRSVASPAD